MGHVLLWGVAQQGRYMLDPSFVGRRAFGMLPGPFSHSLKTLQDVQLGCDASPHCAPLYVLTGSAPPSCH